MKKEETACPPLNWHIFLFTGISCRIFPVSSRAESFVVVFPPGRRLHCRAVLDLRASKHINVPFRCMSVNLYHTEKMYFMYM